MSKLILFPAVDKITLSASHSLIAGSVPEFITKVNSNTEFFDTLDRNHLESFGLFDTASPNFQTYYPDVKVNELANSADYIEPVFRCLSEVIVRKAFDPIDFSKNGVLKASMKKLTGQTVYPNHEALVGNEIGVVAETFWEDAYQLNGLKIPAGINAKFKINGKVHPKIAAGILTSPPEIHSNSVTVFFGWEQSHSKLSAEEFRAKVGSYDQKGELIRRVVTDIKRYNETSLVPHGADPFAQLIKDGKIVNPEYGVQRDSLSENNGTVRRYFGFSYKDDNLEELSENSTIPKNINNIEGNTEKLESKKPKMKKELALLLALSLGLTINEEMTKLSDEDFEAQFDVAEFSSNVLAKKSELEKIAQLDALTTELQTAKDESVTLTEKIETLEAEAVTNAQLSSIGALAQEEMLSDVKRLYGLTAGEKQSDKILSAFETADFKSLQAFKTNYEIQLAEKFSQTCPKCGEQVSLGADHQFSNENKNEAGKNHKLDPYALAEKIRLGKESVDISNLHG